MMAYATVGEVMSGFRTLSTDEQATCEALLSEAAIIIDAYAVDANESRKALVSCRMVRRVLGDGESYPIGATQGSASALGYSQSWTINGGSVGELYISRIDKKLLCCNNRIGSFSPVEVL